jgi:choline dehydrogenase
VRTGVTIRRVVFDGLRAVGVSGLAGGRDIEVRARCAVILSAGTIMSPALLQRSGIGPAEYLRSAGVPVLYDSPAVGTGLQEHLALGMPYRLRGERGLNHRYRSIGLAPDLVRYGLTRTGPMATGPFEVGAFARVTKGADRPDVQLYLSAVSREAGTYRPERQPGFTIYGQLLRLTSRGSIRITSAHPEDLPYIEPNWLTTEADRRAAVDLVRYMRRYVQQDSLAPYVGEELAPGASYHDDKEILEVFRRMSTCGLHAVGTVPMGKEDAAVDERLRVRGVQGLRVVDCSVMPSLVSGNTSGPAMALSWRAADLILEDGAGA